MQYAGTNISKTWEEECTTILREEISRVKPNADTVVDLIAVKASQMETFQQASTKLDKRS
jgi:hypothetical protein